MQDPDELLRRCVKAYEEAKQKGFLGFKWTDCGIRPQTLNKLCEQGYLKVVYKSKSKTRYAVVQKPQPSSDGRWVRVWLSKKAYDALNQYMQENDIWDLSQALEELILQSPRLCPRNPYTLP